MSNLKSNLLSELTTQEAAAIKGGKHGADDKFPEREFEREFEKPEKAYYYYYG
jgi:hypothetical protein